MLAIHSDHLRTQLTGLVGAVRNLGANITAASSSATFTADQVVVGTALNGLEYLLPSFVQTVNLASVGAGGMDTGTAPVSGFVAIYAIYNPTAGTTSILATNATSAAAPTIYAGAHMPSGYTASALISVWPTNGSSLFSVAAQVDRDIFFTNTQVVNSTVQITSLTAVSIASTIPKNARTIRGALAVSSANASQNSQVNIYSLSTTVGFGAQNANSTSGEGQSSVPFNGFPILTPQTFWWTALVSSGTFLNGNVAVAGYSI